MISGEINNQSGVKRYSQILFGKTFLKQNTINFDEIAVTSVPQGMIRKSLNFENIFCKLEGVYLK